MDMEDRINQLISEENADNRADTFADRADAYYRRRPRLISVLHDLYNDYVSLADRYTRALTKLNTHPSPPPSSFDDGGSISDAESSLSYQPTATITQVLYKPNRTTPSAIYGGAGVDAVVAELVMKNVDNEFLKHEMEVAARDSGRKIELQRSLVEVLESERIVLLGENSRLVYRAELLAEERNAITTENAFLLTRANQLANCVMRLQEERRGVVLGRQIEDLQRQIYALQIKKKTDGNECFCAYTPPHAAEGRRPEGKKWSGWWRRLRKIGAAPCGTCSSGVEVG